MMSGTFMSNDQLGDTKHIKEEPIEEILFPETVFRSTSDDLIENCCFLCIEGKDILRNLHEHLMTHHHTGKTVV
jgi:hypothetical protein